MNVTVVPVEMAEFVLTQMEALNACAQVPGMDLFVNMTSMNAKTEFVKMEGNVRIVMVDIAACVLMVFMAQHVKKISTNAFRILVQMGLLASTFLEVSCASVCMGLREMIVQKI